MTQWVAVNKKYRSLATAMQLITNLHRRQGIAGWVKKTKRRKDWSKFHCLWAESGREPVDIPAEYPGGGIGEVEPGP